MSAADRLAILVAGVGGQGVLSAARWLGDAATAADLPLRVGQLHGMSQRGGSVQATVLIGPGQSSFIVDGAADVMLAFEPLELHRALPKMGAQTRAIVNLGQIVPFTLAQRGQGYPAVENLLEQVRERVGQLICIDGSVLSQQTGAVRGLNVMMLGALFGLGVLPFDEQTLLGAIERRCPPKLVEPNRRAFALGKEAVQT